MVVVEIFVFGAIAAPTSGVGGWDVSVLHEFAFDDVVPLGVADGTPSLGIQSLLVDFVILRRARVFEGGVHRTR